MGEERVEAHALVAQDVDSDAHGREDAHELGAHGVGEAHARVGGVGEDRLRRLLADERLGGQRVVGHNAARVGLARERVVIQGVVDCRDTDVGADQARKVREPADPRVELGRAVVRVHHGDGRAVGRGHHVDLGVQLGEGALEDSHQEDGGTTRDVARALGDRVRGDHARARVTFRRAQPDTGLKRAGRVDERSPLGGQRPRVLARAQHGRKDVAQAPRDPLGHQGLVLIEVGLHIGTGFRVDREHTRGVTDTQDVAARQLVVDPAGQRRQAGDARRMSLGVEDRLVQVRDRPAQRNVKAEETGELIGRAAGVRVAPRTERREQVALGIEGEVAVHHRGDADRAISRGGDVVALAHVSDQGCVGALQAGDDLVEGVRPQAALEMVLPPVAAGGKHLVVGADQDGLDAGRAKLDAERGVGGSDGGAGVGAHVCSLGLH